CLLSAHFHRPRPAGLRHLTLRTNPPPTLPSISLPADNNSQIPTKVDHLALPMDYLQQYPLPPDYPAASPSLWNQTLHHAVASDETSYAKVTATPSVSLVPSFFAFFVVTNKVL